jgi:hypothetical protein
MFQTDSEQLFFSSDGCESPLEKEVIQKLSDEGRFYDFGHRTQINFNNISLLVKNMPIDDPERYGRLKDIMAYLMGSARAKMHTLKARVRLINQVKVLSGTIDLIRTNISDQAVYLQSPRSKSLVAIKNLLNEFEEKIPTLGLDEDQEEFLIGKLDKTVAESSAELDSNSNFKRNFEGILRLLQHVIDNQNNLLKEEMELCGKDEDNSVENSGEAGDAMDDGLFGQTASGSG